MSVTIKDIARIAGVNHSTVSRSLNDSPLISDETKKRIQEIAKNVGFEFNANARGLISKKTGTVAIIYPESFEVFSTHLFYGSFQSRIAQIFEREGLDVIVTFPKNRFTGESNLQKLINKKKIDGVMMITPFIDNNELNFLRNSNIPFIFLHSKPEASLADDVDFIYTDHFKGGYIATEHLIKHGIRKIACISEPGKQFELRVDGYRAALSDNGITVNNEWIFYGNGDCSFESGERLTSVNLDVVKEVDALFIQTDLMALGAIEALRKHNIKVPDDMAIIGYDDIELGSYFTPKLTTVHQPREETALLACERLIDVLKSNKKRKAMIKSIQPTLVVRESCGTAKKNIE
ncbi:MAG: LacI family transcriptional regulator [Clostridia bacterium]|nr:LacI family transcriptional regulator [Clostridia bacterium]